MGLNIRVSECFETGKSDLIIMSPYAQSKGNQRGHLAIFRNVLLTT